MLKLNALTKNNNSRTIVVVRQINTGIMHHLNVNQNCNVVMAIDFHLILVDAY